ncbi:hypothetical protein [Caproicibacter sp.]|uniref:hypothetical protein n=1 Tax=Caproicibacter sp. TaxID=2814884 RepID=UPI0039899DEB
MCDIIKVSPLGKTWVLDLDGTIVKHNGYKIDGHDTLLDGAKKFLDSLSPDDLIVFITSRTDEYRKMTEDFLKENGIRCDSIIFNAPYGERILINDKKPSGLNTAIAVNTERDRFCEITFAADENL